MWRAAGLNHLILEQGGQIHGAALDALEAECPGAVNILARMPPPQSPPAFKEPYSPLMPQGAFTFAPCYLHNGTN